MGRIELVGIDVGGTFIDYVALDHGSAVRVHKVLNRPADLAAAILEGFADVAPEGAREVVHGTTVATNAIIERRGAKVALITTRGFADVIEIGRQDRPDLYSLESWRPEPLAPASLRLEAIERVTSTGEVLQELTNAEVERLVDGIRATQPDAVAVCLLFSFLRPEHETRIAAALSRETPFVTTSTEVIPEYREYERTATTVANAYVSPLLADYLDTVSDALTDRFGVEDFGVMQSNGGILTGHEAARQGVRLLLSGPAGGVTGAFELARRRGIERVITFDMGGTSTDVALCDGSIPTTVERDVAGVPIRLPMVEIETVGAGGGSIARVDAGGALRVGPESAGADPGPACFGRGELATVTDAQAVCGLLDAPSFLGGKLKIEFGRARRAIRGVAARMGMDDESTAEGILRVANASVEQAIRRISIERGHDPREFTLIAFGGAGPLHACAVAEGLEMSTLIIPPFPGVLSALGMAKAAVARDFSMSVVGLADLDGVWRALEAKALAAVPEGQTTRTVDCRYRGQGYELEVEAEPADGIMARFHAAHLRRFGFEDYERAVEYVTARIRVRRERHAPDGADRDPAPKVTSRSTRLRWSGQWWDAPVIARDGLVAGERVPGPSLLVQPDAATFVAPQWVATVASDGTLVAERHA